jgi:hypothetical protein
MNNWMFLIAPQYLSATLEDKRKNIELKAQFDFVLIAPNAIWCYFICFHNRRDRESKEII